MRKTKLNDSNPRVKPFKGSKVPQTVYKFTLNIILFNLTIDKKISMSSLYNCINTP